MFKKHLVESIELAVQDVTHADGRVEPVLLFTITAQRESGQPAVRWPTAVLQHEQSSALLRSLGTACDVLRASLAQRGPSH